MAYYLTRFGSTIFPLAKPITAMPTADGLDGTQMTVDGGLDAWGSDTAPAKFPIQISYRVMVVDATAATYITTINALRALARTRAYLYRTGQDGTVHRALARLLSIDAQDTVETFAAIELTFTFELWSHWEAKWDHAWTFDDGEYFDTGLYFDDSANLTTLTTSPQTVTITNGGNLPVDDVIITITAGNADITALSIVCGSAKWSFSGTIGAGKALVVDAGAWSVHNDGSDAYDDFAFDSGHALSGILRLAVGSNSLVITRTGGGTGSTVGVQFAEAWA